MSERGLQFMNSVDLVLNIELLNVDHLRLVLSRALTPKYQNIHNLKETNDDNTRTQVYYLH